MKFSREDVQESMLTAFFKLNDNDPFAKTLLFNEVPAYYTWDSKNRAFRRRVRGEPVVGEEGVKMGVLGRVYAVHPRHAECYFLRFLLHTVK